MITLILRRYHCGSAREFHYADGSQSPSQAMTCLWDKTWSATTQLGDCQWVACLKVNTQYLLSLYDLLIYLSSAPHPATWHKPAGHSLGWRAHCL